MIRLSYYFMGKTFILTKNKRKHVYLIEWLKTDCNKHLITSNELFIIGKVAFVCDFEPGNSCDLLADKTDEEDWLAVTARLNRDPYNKDHTTQSGQC